MESFPFISDSVGLRKSRTEDRLILADPTGNLLYSYDSRLLQEALRHQKVSCWHLTNFLLPDRPILHFSKQKILLPVPYETKSALRWNFEASFKFLSQSRLKKDCLS